MEFVIPKNVYCVNSVENTVNVKLNILPDNFDVQSMMFTEDPPKCLKAIEVLLGGQRILQVDKPNFRRNNDMLLEDLCGSGLKLSKCSYMHTCIKLEFDREYMREREVFEMVPEMREVVIHSDSEFEYYDGLNYRFGNRVSRQMKPTGNQVRHIIKSVDIECPDILFNLVNPSRDEYETSSVWQTINIHGSENHMYLEKLRDTFGLKLADDRYSDLDDAIASKQSFRGKMENTIHYAEGMAGLSYTFTASNEEQSSHVKMYKFHQHVRRSS